MKKKTEGGFIALTSVLIIGAVVLVLGVSLFHSALTDYSISSTYESGQTAAFLADFCLKEGILKLKEDIDYKGYGEEIEVNGMVCYISLVEDINGKTKKVSSLGRAEDKAYFSRLSQLIRYVIEPEEGGWDSVESENLEITEEGFLKLESFEEIVILNSTTSESCDTLCQQEETGYQCLSVGTDPAASNGNMWTVFQENGEYSCIEEEADCGSLMLDYSQLLSDCNGQAPAWTYCRCEYGEVEGHRTSLEFDISDDVPGQNIVRESQIFWQADERLDGTIKVEVRVFDGAGWGEWEVVSNGAGIPGLEAGTSLSRVKMKTKTSFFGGPDFYPILKNIKIFIELE